MKTVLVVGAGRYQRAVIRKARELGLRVVAVDRNPDAPGLREADVGRVVDFSSPGAVLEEVRGLGIDGVLTVQAERAVPMIAELAESLGVPGIGVETARLMTNKLAMRARLAEAGVPQPRFATVRTAAEAGAALADLGLPAVLKPADASGQLGVARIASADELERRFATALEASPTGEAVLEEFVEGVELNGIVVVQDGEVLAVVLCDRLRPPGRSFGVSWLHVYPPSVEGARLAEAKQVAADAVRALGLRSGIGFPQLLARPEGGVALVECAARIGGMMAEHLQHALGIDLLEIALRLALGEPVTAEHVRERFRRPVAVRFLTADPGTLTPGRVTRIGPLDPVLAAPGVLDASIFSVVGETIRPVMIISDRRGYVIAAGETREEAVARADAAALLVEIDVEAA
ncbi:MAG TPA: ATP-grasp domain-containing protein [Gaiellaceae bacterium]|jgi:biotin carboxylase